MNETTLKQVASYVPEALYDKVAADAKANKRSISAQLHLILEQHYESQEREQQQQQQK